VSQSNTQTLPDHYYHSREIYDLECEHIFRRHWWLIGPESQFANTGDYLALQLMKWPLVIVRDQQANLRGFYNLCRHRAGPLVLDGNGHCRDFVCRYHGWRYACSGELLKTPGFDQSEIPDFDNMGLLPIRVECWNGLVFACLDDNANDLLSWLGDIIDIAQQFPSVESMVFQGDVIKPGQSNWKTYADNSCEGYHVGMVHRALGSSMLRESVRIDSYENGEFVGFDVTYTGKGEDQSRAGKGFWIYKFPGLLLHFADYAFNTEVVIPVSEDEVQLRRWFWVDQQKASAKGIDVARIRPDSERVMDEDMAICALVQRNLESGIYPGGSLSASKEVGTIYFQQLVRVALEGQS
jgi:choline monooxygenase